MFFKTSLFLALVSIPGHASGLTTYNQNLIFQPPSNYTDPRTLYPRTVQLSDGRLLATWENYSPEPPAVWFPIYESLNGGVSWTQIGKVVDQVNGWGMRYQPFLYELPQNFGGFAKGTLLCAGSSIPKDLSRTQIEMYASTDKGRTWNFVSHIAAGGKAVPNNGETPVWEPFILLYQDTLIVYYADQRDPAHGQKLVHQETADLRAWSAPITDVAYPKYNDRPGMPVVTQLGNGSYMYAYEWGGGPVVSSYTFPIYYRIASDPRQFASVPANFIRSSNGGVIPISSPNIVWSPVGGFQGSIIASSGSAPVFINRNGGAPNSWVAYNVPESAAYTRNLRVMSEDTNYLLIMGAGKLPPSTTNKVTVSMLKISQLLGI